jgi:hypothetical protein
MLDMAQVQHSVTGQKLACNLLLACLHTSEHPLQPTQQPHKHCCCDSLKVQLSIRGVPLVLRHRNSAMVVMHCIVGMQEHAGGQQSAPWCMRLLRATALPDRLLLALLATTAPHGLR